MEAVEITAWQRPLFQSSLHDARLLWVVWMPDGDFELSFDAQADGFPTPDADLGGLVIRSVPAPTLRELESTMSPLMELTPEVDTRLLEQCRAGLAVAGELPDPKDLSYLQTAHAILRGLSKLGAVAALDLIAQRFWDGEELLEVPPQRNFAVREHIVVLTRPSDGRGRMLCHTRGMAKFARPELFLRGLGPADLESAPEFINELALRSALGKSYRDQSLVRLTPPAGELPMVTFHSYIDDTAEAHPEHGLGKAMFANASLEVLDFDEEAQKPCETCQVLLAALRK